MLPFKLVADDSAGLISVCEFTLPRWSSGLCCIATTPSTKACLLSPEFSSSSWALTG